MSVVNALLHARWRSGNHIGAAKPTQLVRVRPIVMDRKYKSFVKLDGKTEDFGDISGSKHNHKPWMADLRILGDWIDVPNVSSVETEDSFDQDGVAEPTAATIRIENVVFKEATGLAGIYHQIKRGFMSPWRGKSSPGRPSPDEPKNEWYELLFSSGCQVRVWQGYGVDGMDPVFSGLVDDADITSDPDNITLTCRSFGMMLTDERLFGWNKAREVPSPVIFSDPLQADDVKKVASSAAASSFHKGYPAKNVLDAKESTFWLSHGHPDPNFTEWVSVRVPAGRYETAFLHPRYPGMETYLSIYCRGGNCQVDDVDVPDGWLDRGLGNVPGAGGGVPFARKWPAINKGPQSKHFGFKLDCGDNTVIRFSFRNLGYSTKYNDYRASVTRMYGARRTRKKEAKKNHWILVDDAADVVKWVLMWAGFKEWEVEKTGVPLKDPMVFHQGDYLVDVIRHIVQQGNFGFHIRRPTGHDKSMGVPVFRRMTALKSAPSGTQEVRDSDLLTGLDVKFATETLSFIIRARGKAAMRDEGGKRLGEDASRRIQATYWPPWSGAHHNIATGEYDHTRLGLVGRTGGVYRHGHHGDAGIETEDEALQMCLLIAFQEALAAFTGEFEIPGYPGIELDEQLSILDRASAMNTRIWVANRHTTFTSGEEGAYTTSISGALLDTPDMVALALDQQALFAKVLGEGQ